MLWSSLKQHGTSRWVRSSYFWLFFVPVAAKFLSTVSETVPFDFGGGQIVVHLALPFSWKLFYLGAVCFSLASFIYYLACPALVRDFDTFSEYSDIGKGSQYIVDQFMSAMTSQMLPGWSRVHISVIGEFLRKYATGSGWGVVDWSNARKVVDAALLEQTPPDSTDDDQKPIELRVDRIAEGFWFARNAVDEAHGFLRGVCAFLYFVGYVMFFVVACQGFLFVVQSN